MIWLFLTLWVLILGYSAGFFLRKRFPALGWSILADVHPFGGSSRIMDLEDFIVSNCLLPLGSLAYVLFCTCRYGWGWEKFMAEANTGKGMKVVRWMRPYMTYVLPVIITVLFLVGIYDFFK